MKSYKLILLAQSIALVFFSLLLAYLYSKALWFSMFFTGSLIILLIIATYYQQQKTTETMKRLIAAIRFSDFTLSFRSAGKKEINNELAIAMDESLKQFRNKLRHIEEQNQYQHTLLSTVDSGMLVINRQGIVEWYNKAAMAELGKTRIEQIDELKTVHPTLPHLLTTLRPGEIKILRIEKDQTQHELAISGILFKMRGKELLLISLKNIHSILETNEIESWQKLIRVLTHEIMNSIAPIISLSETVTDRAAINGMNEKDYTIMLQAIQAIHRRSKGLLEFVENYRKLTRIPTPEISSINIEDLFGGLRKLFCSETIKYSFILEQPGLKILADRTQIEQVLINLIKNAEEASQECTSPHIEIRAHQESQRLCISITDHGKGIIPEALDKIFVPFFTTKPGGSGIGLSLCKQIMALHNGNITVNTENGKGSTFTLQFRT